MLPTELRPVLGKLVLRAVECMGLDSRAAHDARMFGLLEHEVIAIIEAGTASALTLPMPSDEQALALVQCVLEQPLSGANVHELAEKHGVARRTLNRRFRDETGMSFGMCNRRPAC